MDMSPAEIKPTRMTVVIRGLANRRMPNTIRAIPSSRTSHQGTCDSCDSTLAAVIFHELTHQRLYVKNNSAFSESLATVVEAEGVRRWLAEIDEPGKLEAYQARKARQKQFAGLISNTRDRLKDVYQLLPGDEPDMAAVRQQKRDEINAANKKDWQEWIQKNVSGYLQSSSEVVKLTFWHRFSCW